MRASRGLKWENKMYKLKRSITRSIVSDDDAIYACVNVRFPRFQPRYKLIRDIKEL